MLCRQVVAALVLGLFGQACSTETNINQFFVSDAQKNSLQSLVDRAQFLYDRGEYADALEFAQDAYDISPGNEDINVLLGYIHIAIAGMDSFTVARGLIDAGSSSSSSSSSSLTEGEELALLASSDSASKFLEKMRGVLGLSDEDLYKLGTLSDGSGLQYFEGIDIIEPSLASVARAVEIDIMEHTNKAISHICPFVDESVKLIDNDSRHNADNCTPTDVDRQSKVKSHFLWAFAHIAEAVAFYSVIMFRDADATEPNIQARSTALSDVSDTAGISDYVAHVTDLSSSVDKLFDTENADSQFNALFYNLTAASKAFVAIGNMPKKVEKSLNKAIESIQDAKDTVGGSETGSLKNQLNSSISDSLEEEINSLAESDPDGFAENQDELCDSYESISGGADLPEACG